MNMFYSVKHRRVTYTLAQSHRVFGQRIPADLLPIGNDAGDNQICLGIGPDNHGKVYLWLMYDEEDIPTYRNICFVAGSFTEFMGMFYEADDDPI